MSSGATAIAYNLTVVDTVGAGDAFTAALTLALVEGREQTDALRFACAAGYAGIPFEQSDLSIWINDFKKRSP